MNLGSQFQAKDEGHARWQDGQRMAGLSSISPEFSRTARKNSNGTIYKLLVAFVVCLAFVFLVCSPSHADNKPSKPKDVGKLIQIERTTPTEAGRTYTLFTYSLKLCKGKEKKIYEGETCPKDLKQEEETKEFVDSKIIPTKRNKYKVVITAKKIGNATISYWKGILVKKQIKVEVIDCKKKEVGVLVAPARSAQITFSAIEAGESVEIPPGRLTGKRATITFVATADGPPIKGPKTELTKTKTGGTAIVFLGGLSAAVTALLRDTEGNQVSISTVPGKSLPAPEELQPTFEGPVPVTDGSMDATVSVPSGKEIVDAAITDEEAKSATVEVVAHKRSESGIIEETAVTASGIPSEACADGSLGFELVTEDNRTIETQMDAFYIGYSMQRITHVGQTASVKAKITGLGDDQVLSFTFVPDVARHGISPLTNQLTVGEINSGAPITSVTSKMIGEHAFDIVVKVAPPLEERLVP